jgi:hypothetical protein
MTNTYQYSIAVDKALASYGARTHGPLQRRVERLKRFTDMKNRQYADEIKIEHARMMANQEREERVKNRLQSPPVFLRRNLRKEFDNAAGWYAMGSPNYLKDTNTIKMKKEAYLAEPSQEATIPTYVRPASTPYNLRPRSNSYHGLSLLCRAIENGFVAVNRG